MNRLPPAAAAGAAFWTAAKVELITRLWREGLSASQIAAVAGATRNAVIGKLARCRLTRSDQCRRTTTSLQNLNIKPKPPKPEIRHQAKVFGETPVKPVAVKVSATTGRTYPQPEDLPLPRRGPEDLSTARPWLTRQFGECPFPIAGEGADTLSCCARTEEGEGYCPTHRARIYEKARSPEQKAADKARAALMRAGRKPNLNSDLFTRRKGRAA